MNKKYITPESEVLYFETEDVIMTSGDPDLVYTETTKGGDQTGMILDSPNNW